MRENRATLARNPRKSSRAKSGSLQRAPLWCSLYYLIGRRDPVRRLAPWRFRFGLGQSAVEPINLQLNFFGAADFYGPLDGNVVVAGHLYIAGLASDGIRQKSSLHEERLARPGRVEAALRHGDSDEQSAKANVAAVSVAVLDADKSDCLIHFELNTGAITDAVALNGPSND